MYEHCAVSIKVYFNQCVNTLNRVALIGLKGILFHSVQRLGTYAPKTAGEVIMHNYKAESVSAAECQKIKHCKIAFIY